MKSAFSHSLLIEQLTPRYGEGEAKAIARIVFEDAFDLGRSFEEARFAEILQRLLAGEPVQYVLGEADFFGLKYKVSPAVLIPRQETEELVVWVLEHLKSVELPNVTNLSIPKNSGLSNFQDGSTLLDIGLGSGCIGITLKKKMPGLQLFGLEKSPSALAISIENAGRILSASAQNPSTVAALHDKFSETNFATADKQIPKSSYPQFLLGDILDRSDWDLFPPLDVIVSNPPYIPHSEKSLVPEHVLAHEPALALFVDDPDPLLFYRTIADFALEKLRSGGVLFFECNEFNAAEVANLLRQKGFSKVELRKDVAGAERMVKGLV